MIEARHHAEHSKTRIYNSNITNEWFHSKTLLVSITGGGLSSVTISCYIQMELQWVLSTVDRKISQVVLQPNFSFRTYAGDTRPTPKKLYKKLAWINLTQFITVSGTTTTGRPITLHGSSHVPDSFCSGIELCSTATKLYKKKLVQDWPTHVQFLVQDDLHKFLIQVSWTCVNGISLVLSLILSEFR